MAETADRYTVECVCGAELRSATLEFRCPHCGAAFSAEWPCASTMTPDGQVHPS